ncbi:hypothetical protein LCGC14_1016170 [marine sediment metagenome]|uniref:Uncharacterized protein n=1 Tax=marine sediment metagenome TaxID=412755 RepID=A0A0F9MYP2_9ZZZZ
MSELTVEQVEELNIEMETWNSSYHDKYKPLFADWHRQRKEIEELIRVNESVAVCANHTNEIIGDGWCIVCELHKR